MTSNQLPVMSWQRIADIMVDRLKSYNEDKGRGLSRLRYRLVKVLGLRGTNYIPSDGDWRELENELRSLGYALIRADAISIGIMDISKFEAWTLISLYGPEENDAA
jgi:hypothetical protein